MEGVITEEEAIEKLQEIKRLSKQGGDPEKSHQDADAVLCDLLESIGLEEVVEEWRGVPKWYA